jgi:NADH:ubiquinone oxidoreductase subunit 2 (subunit N)
VVNTVISLYYYLRVIAPTFLEPAPPVAAAPAGVRQPLAIALAVSAAATVGFGIAAEPLLDLADRATMLGG